MTLVRLTEPAPGVRLLLLGNPAKRNALDARMREALAGAIAQVAAGRAARVLVITDAGTAFCSGADVPSLLREASREVAALRDDLRDVYLPPRPLGCPSAPALGRRLARRPRPPACPLGRPRAPVAGRPQAQSLAPRAGSARWPTRRADGMLR